MAALPGELVAGLDRLMPTLTISDLQRLMDGGELSSEILTLYLLRRIDQYDAGYPAITIPLGVRSGGGIAEQLGLVLAGMPVGVTLIGKQGEDDKLIGYAFAFEQVSHYRMMPNLAQ